MRLRTLTGTRWPAKCADGCGTNIPAGPDVKVVVDFESKPRKTWIPEHSPDAGTYRGNAYAAPPSAAPSNGGGATTGYVPANAFAKPPAPAPQPPTAPPPPRPSPEVAHTGPDSGPNPASGRGWASSQLVFNAGQFESVKAGFASYAKDGETEEKLRERVHTTVLSDVEWQVRAVRDLHERLGVPGSNFGRTSSPAHAAGAPPAGAYASPSCM